MEAYIKVTLDLIHNIVWKALEHLDSRYNEDKDMFKSAIEFFDTQILKRHLDLVFKSTLMMISRYVGDRAINANLLGDGLFLACVRPCLSPGQSSLGRDQNLNVGLVQNSY